MTRFTAIQAMRSGKKVTHKYFSKGEWATQDNGQILLEDGVKCSPAEFWKYRQEEFFNDGWEIFQE